MSRYFKEELHSFSLCGIILSWFRHHKPFSAVTTKSRLSVSSSVFFQLASLNIQHKLSSKMQWRISLSKGNIYIKYSQITGVNGLSEHQPALDQLSRVLLLTAVPLPMFQRHSLISSLDTHTPPNYSHFPYSISASHPAATALIRCPPSYAVYHFAAQCLPTTKLLWGTRLVHINLCLHAAARQLTAWVASKIAGCVLWLGDRPWQWHTNRVKQHMLSIGCCARLPASYV